MWNNKKNYVIIGLLILTIMLSIGLFLDPRYAIEQNSEKDSILKITQACEDGCVMSQGLNYEDYFLDAPDKINDKIFICIFKCNDKYYYGS